MLKMIALVSAAILLVVSFVLFRWTHTPYGRMDFGPAVLSHLMGLRPLEMTPEARVQANAYIARFMGEPPEGVEIRDLEFDGPAGPLPLRVYLPRSGTPTGVVAWIHGGGFWMGDDLALWDGTCGRLAVGADVIVASIGYRLAPESPFPAAVEDSWAGLLFTAANAQAWGAPPDRFAVTGGSAGGNLAAVMAQRARDEGGPRLLLQALTVPAVNAGGPDTESMQQFSKGYGLDGIPKMIEAYLPKPGDAQQVWASPILATHFDGLAPALIHTAEFDPLRDEGELYAEKLRAAGVPVELERFDGAIHGFLGSPDTMARAEAGVIDAMRRAFAGASAGDAALTVESASVP
jgi:acetyl esterase